MDTFRHEVTISPGIVRPTHGCLVDGHTGVYGITEVIRIATELGFPIDADGAREVRAYNAGNGDLETVIDLADAAERWLNDNIAGEHEAFGWHDGEFFFQHADWFEGGE